MYIHEYISPNNKSSIIENKNDKGVSIIEILG